MPTINVIDQLTRGKTLLMDGGTGSELQRRGVKIVTTPAGTPELYPWGALANIEAPDVVEQIHSDYLRVGAQIIISNSFWTNPIRLEPAGVKDRWAEYAQAAARLAVKARDALNPEAYVAGGMAPPTMYRHFKNTASDTVNLGEEALYKLFVDEAQVLAKNGVDIMLPEYVWSIDDCIVAVDASATTGLPVFLGITNRETRKNKTHKLGQLASGETLKDLAESLKGHAVDAILLMCETPEAISASIPILRSVYDGPIGCYPNIGYSGHPEDRFQTVDYTIKEIFEYALEWKQMGANIIGGCCGAGPEHVFAIREAINEEN